MLCERFITNLHKRMVMQQLLGVSKGMWPRRGRESNMELNANK